MKKIKLSSEACCAACFTIIQIVCVVIATAFVLQSPTYGSIVDVIGCVGYIAIAILVEIAKYKVVHIWYKDKVIEDIQTNEE